MFDLTGKVALVTGAGRGVGAGIARTLAAQGAAVAVNDFFDERAAATADDLAAAGAASVAVPFDVTDYPAVFAGVQRGTEALGPIDILVNNAGIPNAMVMMSFRDSSPEIWQRFIDLNLYGVLNCAHAVVGAMCEGGWGRIITISSEAGRHGV